MTGLSDQMGLSDRVFGDSEYGNCLRLAIWRFGRVPSCCGELELPAHECADELETVIDVGLVEAPKVATHRADAMTLGHEQGFELLFPEGAFEEHAGEPVNVKQVVAYRFTLLP